MSVSSTFKNLSRFTSWGETPIMRRASLYSPKASFPNTSTDPESGRARLTRLFMSVVFPAPFGPSSPKNLPAPTRAPPPDHPHRPRVGPRQADEAVYERRLPRPVRSEQPEELACPHLQR